MGTMNRQGGLSSARRRLAKSVPARGVTRPARFRAEPRPGVVPTSRRTAKTGVRTVRAEPRRARLAATQIRCGIANCDYARSGLKLGLLQLNSTIGDFAANRQKLLAGYEKACALGAEFVLAPEFFCAATRRATCSCARILLPPTWPRSPKRPEGIGAVPLCVGYVDRNPERPGRALRNSAAVLQNGKIVWRTHKCLLPTYDVFDEDRYFEPAKTVAPFEFNGRKLGITICEDIWNDEDFWPERLYRRDPVKELIAQGAEIIFNISASPWHDGKERTRLAMLRRVARDEGVPLAQVNLVGANDELIFDGHSVALDARGEVLALGKGFAEEFWWWI